MSLNEARFAPEELSLIQSVLEPGDTLLELCKFFPPVGQGRPRGQSSRQSLVSGPGSVALTNKYIHFISYRPTRRGDIQIMRHATVPLSNISSIAVRTRPKNIVLTFWCEGRQESMSSTWVDEATEFANHLQRLVTTKETTGGTLSIADEIAKLAQLTEEGILSDDELSRAKELFLGQPTSNIDQSIKLLRNLKELNKQGVLSESEFNMKKWDILSKRDLQ